MKEIEDECVVFRKKLTLRATSVDMGYIRYTTSCSSLFYFSYDIRGLVHTLRRRITCH